MPMISKLIHLRIATKVQANPLIHSPFLIPDLKEV
jgi:hypothetical protein